MGVSLNGGTPKTPQNDHNFVGKPMAVGYHHFGNHHILPTQAMHYWGQIPQNYHGFRFFDPPTKNEKTSEMYPRFQLETLKYVSSWWFQPIWKILYRQIGSFPQVGVKIQKNWNNHLGLGPIPWSSTTKKMVKLGNQAIQNGGQGLPPGIWWSLSSRKTPRTGSPRVSPARPWHSCAKGQSGRQGG